MYMFAEKRVQGTWRLAEPPELHVKTVLGFTGGQWLRPVSLAQDANRSTMDVLIGDGGPCDLPGSFDPPRGLPYDLSPILWAEAQLRISYSHSHSWLSFAELLEFDWYGRTERVYGRVRSEYAALFDESQPFPPGVPRGMWAWESIGSPPPHRTLFVSAEVPVSWIQTYADAKEFLDTIFPVLHSYGTPADVRVVFWFS